MTDLSSEPPASETEREILRHLRTLRYGALEIQVHDARIVQIERRERVRFTAPRPTDS